MSCRYVVQVREIPIVVQDRTFDTNGQLFYPVNDLATFNASIVLPKGQVPPKWIPGDEDVTTMTLDCYQAKLTNLNRGLIAPACALSGFLSCLHQALLC